MHPGLNLRSVAPRDVHSTRRCRCCRRRRRRDPGGSVHASGTRRSVRAALAGDPDVVPARATCSSIGSIQTRRGCKNTARAVAASCEMERTRSSIGRAESNSIERLTPAADLSSLRERVGRPSGPVALGFHDADTVPPTATSARLADRSRRLGERRRRPGCRSFRQRACAPESGATSAGAAAIASFQRSSESKRRGECRRRFRWRRRTSPSRACDRTRPPNPATRRASLDDVFHRDSEPFPFIGDLQGDAVAGAGSFSKTNGRRTAGSASATSPISGCPSAKRTSHSCGARGSSPAQR